MSKNSDAERHAIRIQMCHSCKAPIIYVLTKNLKHMPCDAASVSIGETSYDSKKHVSHFATCPNAAQHRKR